MIDEQICVLVRPFESCLPGHFPQLISGTVNRVRSWDVSIFGPPPLPVTMTTAVDDGERRKEAGWPAERRQVLLRFAHRP